MERFTKDFLFAIRQLFRSRGFAITAILTLALAIGANTAIFTLFNQALLRALPVRDPGQLVVLSFAGSAGGHTTSEGGDTPGHRYSFSYPMFRDLRERNTAFSGLIATGRSTAGVAWNDHAEQVPVELVSGNYFDVLGVRPAMGRTLLPSDETAENANPVVVLSFDYWKNHLAEAPVTGKTMLVNGYPFTVVGVAAPGFHSMVWGRVPSLYVPITMQRVIEPEWNYLSDHRSYWLNVVGRLRDNETREQALANIGPLWTALRTNEFPLQRDQSEKRREEFITKSHLNLDAGAKGFSPYRDELRTPLLIMMGMMLLVISMAIVNVASLLLVRASTRVREFSMRYALGATNFQVLRQLIAEGLLLGISGAAAGLVLATPALRALIAWIAGRTSQTTFTAQLDWRVLMFTMSLALVASLLFSLAPALQFWNPRLADALRQQVGTGSGASVKFRRTCVALQVGLSLLLVIGAGVFMRTIQNLRNVNPGFATDHLLTFEFAPELAGYPSDQVMAVEQRVLESLAALPGVKAVGATNDADLAGNGIDGDVKVSGHAEKPEDGLDVELPWVSDNYHQTLGIPLIAGRYFAASDTATATKVVIVNEKFARHYFKTPQEALGYTVTRPDHPETTSVIVGVVADAKHASLRDAAKATAYRPFVQCEKATSLNYLRAHVAAACCGCGEHSRSHCKHRQQADCERSDDDEHADRRHDYERANDCHAGHSLWQPGDAACGDWPVRHAGLLHCATHTGVRDSHGAGCAAILRDSTGDERDDHFSQRYDRGHDSTLHPADEGAAEPALQRLDCRPWNLRDRDIDCWVHGVAGGDDSGTQSGFHRSCDGASHGVAPRLAEDIGVEKFVAEFSLRIVLLAELDEVVDARVLRSQLLRWHGEELSPVRARLIGSERFFDERQKSFHFGPFLFPREVNGDAGLLVAGAHPQVVCGDRADFRDEQVRCDLAGELFDGEDGIDRVLAWNIIFRLQLFTGAGRKAHLEVRQALVPGADDSHLLGAVFRRERRDGVKIFAGEFCAEEIRLCVECRLLIFAALQPHFAEELVLPIGEEADAVGAGLDGIEVLLHRVEGKVLIDILPHHEGGLNIERDLGDDTQRAEAHDCTFECVAVLLARELDDIACRGNEFERGYLSGKVAVLFS